MMMTPPSFALVTLLLLLAVAEASTSASGGGFSVPLPSNWLPKIINLERDGNFKDVPSCCKPVLASGNDDEDDDEGCVTDSDSDSERNNNSVCVGSRPTLKKVLYEQRASIGKLPQFTRSQTLDVLENHALKAWNGGAGEWVSQFTLKQRCDAVAAFFAELQSKREIMVQTLMHEIGKNRKDAESEFDRTVQFAEELIEAIKANPEFSSDSVRKVGSTRAFVRRGAIGVILALAPYNYPLNECYAAIIPALLMGNVVVLKIPTVGGLVHLLTMDAFAKTLPRGVVNFVSGRGRDTMPVLMETGRIDGLAFIGGSKAADSLIKSHPHPHRLKVFLQLEANNMAIYLPDLFNTKDKEPLNNALSQAVSGSLSYNGQRCTALKLHFVPKKYAQQFVADLVERVEALPVGLPDEKHGDNKKYSAITPLPAGANRVEYMRELIDDALAKGAKVVNENGGTLVGGSGSSGSAGESSTLMVPAVLYPVTSDMRIYHEEQFGPIVPVVEYDGDLDEILEYGRTNPYGQQVSVFGYDSTKVSSIIDKFANVFGKINLNVQCGRSPDTLPFSGRRSSAMGVMSVADALREFSVPVVVAYKQDSESSTAKMKKKRLAHEVQAKTNFLQPV